DRVGSGHRGGQPRTRGVVPPPPAAAGPDPAAHARGRAGRAPRLLPRRLRRRAALPVPRPRAGPALGRRGHRPAAAGRAGHLGLAPGPGGGAGRRRPCPGRDRHGLPDVPRARCRMDARRRPAGGHQPVPRRGQRRLGPGRARLQPVHDRHRLAVPARDRLRHGGAARRLGERRPGLPRRRRDQPGRGQRGDDLRRQLLRARRLLLPEQPVRDQRPAGAADPDPAVPARGRLRLPGRARRRQRRPRRPRRDAGRVAGCPRGSGPHLHRGVHLPDGRAHDLRRPHPLPAGQRAGGMEAARPDRPAQGPPLAQRDRRRRVLRLSGRRGRRAGRADPPGHHGDARPRSHHHVRPRLRRADAAAGRPAGRVRRLPRQLRGRRAM
ncbi:MAG: Branched-chain alpha-keto acid dehydrogenase, E1 component, alpha subunit, partial [uncultured Blastococcus sp.]